MDFMEIFNVNFQIQKISKHTQTINPSAICLMHSPPFRKILHICMVHIYFAITLSTDMAHNGAHLFSSLTCKILYHFCTISLSWAFACLYRNYMWASLCLLRPQMMELSSWLCKVFSYWAELEYLWEFFSSMWGCVGSCGEIKHTWN